MRDITHIVIHCSATIEGRPHTVQEVERWHKAKGWASIGYHYVVTLDGKAWTGRPERSPGAHVGGHNSTTIGVCYIGGLDLNAQPKDTRTDAQKAGLLTLLRSLKGRYPTATILGHRDLSPDKNKDGKVTPDEWVKACPCFDAQPEYAGVLGQKKSPVAVAVGSLPTATAPANSKKKK